MGDSFLRTERSPIHVVFTIAHQQITVFTTFIRKVSFQHKWRGVSKFTEFEQKKMSHRDEGSSDDNCNDRGVVNSASICE